MRLSIWPVEKSDENSVTVNCHHGTIDGMLGARVLVLKHSETEDMLLKVQAESFDPRQKSRVFVTIHLKVEIFGRRFSLQNLAEFVTL